MPPAGPSGMDSPSERLHAAARDDWVDPTVTARRIGEALLAEVEQAWAADQVGDVQELRLRRADSPLLLAITEPALEADPQRVAAGITAALARLEDWSWAESLGSRVSSYRTAGVLSLGLSTLAVLEAAVAAGRGLEEFHTDRRAVAKGLEYLLLPVVTAPPEKSDVLLIPAVAFHGPRVWTTTRAADAVLRAKVHGRQVVSVAHPLAELSPRNRRAFRPAPYVIDIEI